MGNRGSLYLIAFVLVALGVTATAVYRSVTLPQPKYDYECEGYQIPGSNTRIGDTLGILYDAKGVSVNSLVNAGCPPAAIVNISGT